MHYFAGIFDAEGWVSLTPSGHFIIGVEIAHKETVESFQKQFGGKVYIPTRKSKKQVYSWRIPSNIAQVKKFIQEIAPLCILKKKQLLILGEYLDQSRLNKRTNRSVYSSQIASFKIPPIYQRKQLSFDPTIKPDEHFFKWLAGFMDGDGYFGVYEYQNYKQRSFDSCIALFNTHAYVIEYIQKHIKGSISVSYSSKNPVWKWYCIQSSSLFVCKSIEPYLVIKKQQCRLIAQYLAIHNSKKYGTSHDEAIISEIREIIKQIKHYNSL